MEKRAQAAQEESGATQPKMLANLYLAMTPTQRSRGGLKPYKWLSQSEGAKAGERPSREDERARGKTTKMRATREVLAHTTGEQPPTQHNEKCPKHESQIKLS